ncbi:Aromatic-L-amino-acid decarboxylase [Zea mays]|jgi:aromatic-L-amino-acid/L-tryptophan decarboxylase|uniref:Tyrosine decarboxylase 1 n=2 Tax=Zea mays TaxID=4577 RepID=K7TUI5_MAIZE|nr:tryptophan decarboxylase 1 [Zea mays]AQK48839.1 Tyrosine decarboxylase 1 [Zea mays]PWZ27437.1 Aromatic-L-amino-acid decarboxylase [Zea mays]|eukprot:XP_008680076.1 aromatic-L-amino-acid decarboxylase [Zea mays]
MGSLSGTSSSLAAAFDADSERFQPLNADDVRSYLHKAVDFIYDYYKSVESVPVLPSVEPGYLARQLKSAPPNAAAPFDVAMHELREAVVPGTTHWASPNFFAFFPATNSAAAIAGELVASAMNTVGFTWQANPAAAELEALALDWLAQLLLLPDSFMNRPCSAVVAGRGAGTRGGGVILGTTSEAMLVTLVAARDAALRRSGSDGVAGITRLTVYAADQTHSTFFKACRLAGFDPANVRSIPTGADTDYALDPARLLEAMRRDAGAGLVPTYVCVTVGTTSSNAVDPVGAAADAAAEFGAWVHVDAAYAGSACICPEFRHHLDGVERVDSLSLSPHKWLLTCLDCTCLWVRDTRRLTDSLETRPEYLRNHATESGAVTDLKDMQVGVGRRFRGLKLWMVMRTYGAAKLRQHIRSDVAIAKVFEESVRADHRFEVVVPRNFALVCFRIRPSATASMTEEDAEVANRELMERLNKSGRAFLANTVIGGKFVLRFAVGSTLQEERHVRNAWDLIKMTTTEIINGEVD